MTGPVATPCPSADKNAPPAPAAMPITADKNTIDADDITNGAMTYVTPGDLDSDGNLIMYVVFSDTTFGNA